MKKNSIAEMTTNPQTLKIVWFYPNKDYYNNIQDFQRRDKCIHDGKT